MRMTFRKYSGAASSTFCCSDRGRRSSRKSPPRPAGIATPFASGRHVLLQMLREGQRVRILDLSLAEFTEPRAEAVLHFDGDLSAAYEPGLAAA